jgi:mRNA turnover protein 4
MAKSKRNKIVSLTKTKKINVSDKKLDLVEKIQKYMDNYNYCYSFYYKNMTTMPMQELRNFFSDSKFVIGKNKVMKIALGRDEEESYKSNSFRLSKFMNNNCGLFFTDKDPEYVVEYIYIFLI